MKMASCTPQSMKFRAYATQISGKDAGVFSAEHGRCAAGCRAAKGVAFLRDSRELSWHAIEVLSRELGIADTMRFLNQFTSGYGNYTEERSDLFADMSLDDIVKAIREQRSH
jgi:hypothetical protein